MHEIKIAQYRAEAATCISRANADSNKSTSARWLKVAADWTRMSDELEAKIHSPRAEIPRDAGN
ncbi:MAG TPA: hypothetical protein VM144_00010 [Aestuariivirga sp.]|nr:hypothetical protein [Aestuariivirga sp.]